MSQQEDPYKGEGAVHYAAHHDKSTRNRLTTKRERAVLKSALDSVGNVDTVLDLPCGTGRFWPVFEAAGVKHLIAGDMSLAMLEVAASHPPAIAQFEHHQLNGFEIDLPDKAVDFISSQRFFHHLSYATDRMQALSEIHRVSRSYAAISLWVDGNIQSRRYLGKSTGNNDRGYGRRICRRSVDVEAEFTEAGFDILQHYDVWPLLTMWRLYLLKIR